jgi:hypothetical protein
MNKSDDVSRTLVLIMEILKQQSEFAVRTHVRLLVLRKAIASLSTDPVGDEAHLRKLEEEAERLALSGEGFPKSDAILQLIKAGKKLDVLMLDGGHIPAPALICA